MVSIHPIFPIFGLSVSWWCGWHLQGEMASCSIQSTMRKNKTFTGKLQIRFHLQIFQTVRVLVVTFTNGIKSIRKNKSQNHKLSPWNIQTEVSCIYHLVQCPLWLWWARCNSTKAKRAHARAWRGWAGHGDSSLDDSENGGSNERRVRQVPFGAEL